MSSKPNKHTMTALVVFALIAVHFYCAARERITFALAPDDIMNLGLYYLESPTNLISSFFLMGEGGIYRTTAAFYYLPIYHIFGLRPAPYHIAAMLLLLINSYILYHVLRRFGASGFAAAIAAVIVSYHPGLTNLQYSTAYIYDILCFSFLYLCVLHYHNTRTRYIAAIPPRRLIAYAAILLLALNAKEIAITLPLLLASYELICSSTTLKNIFSLRWLLREGRLLSVSAIMATCSLAGKLSGERALAQINDYKPVVTLDRAIAFQQGAIRDIFCLPSTPSRAEVLIVLVATVACVYLFGSQRVRFFFCVALLSTVPLMFLDGRFEGCLYIPMSGWAVLTSETLNCVTARLGSWVQGQWASRGVVLRAATYCMFSLLVAIPWLLVIDYFNTNKIVPFGKRQGHALKEAANSIAALQMPLKDGDKIVIMNDPFKDYDAQFLLHLVYGNRHVRVNLHRLHPDANETAMADYIIAFDGTDCYLRKDPKHPAFQDGRYDDLESNLKFKGKWIRDWQFSQSYHNTLTYCRGAECSVEIQFWGSRITLIYTEASNRGMAEVSLDGGTAAVIDMYGEATRWRRERTYAAPSIGMHFLRLRVLEKKHPRATDTYVDLDGFVVE